METSEKLKRIVYSCRTEEQLESCKRIAPNLKMMNESYHQYFTDLISVKSYQMTHAGR